MDLSGSWASGSRISGSCFLKDRIPLCIEVCVAAGIPSSNGMMIPHAVTCPLIAHMSRRHMSASLPAYLLRQHREQFKASLDGILRPAEESPQARRAALAVAEAVPVTTSLNESVNKEPCSPAAIRQCRNMCRTVSRASQESVSNGASHVCGAQSNITITFLPPHREADLSNRWLCPTTALFASTCSEVFVCKPAFAGPLLCRSRSAESSALSSIRCVPKRCSGVLLEHLVWVQGLLEGSEGDGIAGPYL